MSRLQPNANIQVRIPHKTQTFSIVRSFVLVIYLYRGPNIDAGVVVNGARAATVVVRIIILLVGMAVVGALVVVMVVVVIGGGSGVVVVVDGWVVLVGRYGTDAFDL